MISRVRKFLEAIFQEFLFLVHHLFLLLITLCLPWRVTFAVLRFLTRLGLGTSALDGAAVRHMLQVFPELSAPIALRQLRLPGLVQLADYYNSWSITPGWLRRYWRVKGDALPPADEHPAVLFVTFHYGAGFWALRYFQQHGLSMAALYRPPVARLGERLSTAFFWLRLRSIARLSGSQPIRVGDSQSELMALARRLLSQRLPVGVMPDIPVTQHKAVEAQIFGRKVYVAKALLRIVVKHDVPVVLYTSVTDLRDGGRNLHLQVIDRHESVERLAQKLADTLQAALLRDPTAWHLWAFLHEIIFDSQPAQ